MYAGGIILDTTGFAVLFALSSMWSGYLCQNAGFCLGLLMLWIYQFKFNANKNERGKTCLFVLIKPMAMLLEVMSTAIAEMRQQTFSVLPCAPSIFISSCFC